MERIKATDTDGLTRIIRIFEYPDGYRASSGDYASFRSLPSKEDAVKEVMTEIEFNSPKQFDMQPDGKQRKLLAFIKEHFVVGKRGTWKRYSSYYLKHVAEEKIGEYVGNGEMKGAMTKAGFTPTMLPGGYDVKLDINCGFVLQRLEPSAYNKQRAILKGTRYLKRM